MVRHKCPADKQEAHLDAKLPEAFDKALGEPITLEKPGAAIRSADGELQQSGGAIWRLGVGVTSANIAC